MMKKILIFLILSSAISGCSGDKMTGNSVSEFGTSLDVFFCPRDNCEDLFVEQIGRASQSVYCAFYEFNSQKLIKTMNEKSSMIPVALVIDEDSYDNQLPKEIVKLANTPQYMHNKFCVIDGNRLITGSANPTNNDFLFNNNNIIISNSPQIVKNYELEFWELWRGIYAKGEKTKVTTINSTFLVESYFCPEDDCTSQVIRTIRTAKHNVFFMAFSFTDASIADAMLMQNVDIKGVMETRNVNGLGSQFARLEGFGIDIIKDKNKKTMHHKVFIIDNETIITGSYNPTKSANSRNDENMLIIHDKTIAAKFVEEFEYVREIS